VITKETSRRLDPEKVVDSALAIADDEGPAAVSFRKLAAQHDVTPMALYRHFKDKDDLLAAIGDRILADVVLPAPNDERWDKQLHALLTAFVTALRGHPRLADLTLPRILITEPGLALSERALELLVEGGFTVDDAAEVGRQAICSLISLVTTDPIAREVSDPEFKAEVDETLARIPEGTTTSVATYWDTRDPSMVSTDKHATTVMISLAGEGQAELSDLNDELVPTLKGFLDDPDGIRLSTAADAQNLLSVVGLQAMRFMKPPILRSRHQSAVQLTSGTSRKRREARN